MDRLESIAHKAFPEYNGKKFGYIICNHPITVRSQWEGGSITYYRFINFRIDAIPIQDGNVYTLVPGVVCVKHTIYCGTDLGLEVLVHPDDASILPEKAEVTNDELIVLIATRSWKNTYAGRSNMRFIEAHKECSITEDRWNTAQQSLISKKLLRKNASLTNEGKNVCGWMRIKEAVEHNTINNTPADELPLLINERWGFTSSEELFTKKLNGEQS